MQTILLHSIRGAIPRVWPRSLLVALGLLLAGACGDDGTGPGLAPEITIAPENPVSLYVGDTLTVHATIRNSRHPAVSYRSSAPEVVEVDLETGLATAVGVGTATISGTSRIDPRIFAEIELTVLPDLPGSLVLNGLADRDGAEVDPAEVAGTVLASYRVEPGSAERLEIMLGERLVCERLFVHEPGDPAPGAVEFECAIDTSGFDQETALPWYTNGTFTLASRLVASGERTLAAAPKMALGLANPPRIVTRMTGERKAVDSAGEEWFGGDLTVDVTPVLYEPGAAIASVTLEYVAPEGQDTTAVARERPFRFTLSGMGVLGKVTDGKMTVSLSSKLEDGGDGPSAGSPPIRYDGAPPVPGALIAREWIGAATRFIETYDAEDESDAGVGRSFLRFYAGDPALSAETIVAEGAEIVTGADLEQSGAGSYRLVAQNCDGLENCVLMQGYEFGVDLTPPLVETVSLADRLANPGADLVVQVRDDLSGFPARMMEVVVRHLDSSPGTAVCGPLVEGVDLPGRPAMGGCAPDTLGNSIPTPRTTAGYYHYTLVAFDRAGNRSEPVERSLLVDLEAPMAGEVVIGGALIPGEDLTATVEVTDDVELAAVDFRLVYPFASGSRSVAIPFAPPMEVGVPFDENLTRAASPSATLPFVRTLTFGSPAGATRATTLIDSIRVIAHDVAGQSAYSARPVTADLFGGDTTTIDPFPRFGAAQVSVDRTAVCSGGCSEADPTSVRISARIEGESGTGRPFARIHFYRRDSDGVLEHLGFLEGTESTIANSGNRSTHLYTLELNPTAGLAGDYGIVAVGVNSRGNALATSLTDAPIVSFYRR